MPQRLSGVWFKLVEPDGFYLGILMVPEGVARMLEDKGCPVRVARRNAMPSWRDWAQGIRPQDYDMVDAMGFYPCPSISDDAIAVVGITLSELNKEPGFAFIPSAEYMQRGPVPEKKPQRRQSAVTEPAPNRFAVLDFPDE